MSITTVMHPLPSQTIVLSHGDHPEFVSDQKLPRFPLGAVQLHGPASSSVSALMRSIGFLSARSLFFSFFPRSNSVSRFFSFSSCCFTPASTQKAGLSFTAWRLGGPNSGPLKTTSERWKKEEKERRRRRRIREERKKREKRKKERERERERERGEERNTIVTSLLEPRRLNSSSPSCVWK